MIKFNYKKFFSGLFWMGVYVLTSVMMFLGRVAHTISRLLG